MRFCGKHWGEIRSAIAARGLDALVASREEAALRGSGPPTIHDGSSGAAPPVPTEATEVPPERFDPLLDATVMLTLKVLFFRPKVETDDGPEGPRCPICVLLASCGCGRGADCSYNGWIGAAADEQLERGKLLGLVGTA